MSTFKKLLALTLALAMVLSVSAFAGYKADTYADAADIDPDCEAAIELLYALDIMVGDGKNFNPKATVTRAEMAKMIYVILNYGEDDGATYYLGAKMFSDVPAGAWYEGYVNYAAATKLVQGRGNGTFGPLDPVTTAEAAKMLLTAIGYSAEARGYTGANWDKNVLADAAVLKLLDGYQSNVNTYAPRQWVAVMMANALEAATYETMYPSFSGLLISGSDKEWDYPSMMEKYLKAHVAEGVMTATDNAALTYKVVENDEGKEVVVADYAAAGTVTIDGEDIKGTGLGYMDLGETFKVIVKGGKALSVRNTGAAEVGVAEIQDITAVVTYGTSSNRANNSYEFTIGDLVATFGDIEDEDNVTYDAAVAIATGSNPTAKISSEMIKAKELYAEMGAKSSDLVKAVAYDGEIAYLIVVDYDYGYVTYDGESKKYGKYIEVETIADQDHPTKVADLEYNGEEKLYLSDAIDYDEEIVEGNFVKYFANPDNELYTMEVLEVVEGATYDKKNNKGVYTISGEKYVFAEDGACDKDCIESKKYEAEFDLVYDGDLIVFIGEIDKTIKNLEEINDQLAIITNWRYLDKIYTKEHPEGVNVYNIKYMTADGVESDWTQYTLTGDVDDDAFETADQIKTWYEAGWRLFILHSEKDETVWMEEITLAGLNASSSLLDGYDEDLSVDISTKYNTIKEDGVKVAEIDDEMLMFIQVDEDEYEVTTVGAMDDGVAEGAVAQWLTKENSRKVPVMLAGYLDLTNLDTGSSTKYGYLYLENDEFDYLGKGKWTADIVIDKDGGTKIEGATIEVADPDEEALYSYSCTNNGTYVLELVGDMEDYFEEYNDTQIAALWKNFEEIEYADGTFYECDDLLAVTYVTIECDEAIEKDDVLEAWEAGYLEEVFEYTEFTTYDELTEDVIAGKTDGDTYFFLTTNNLEEGDDNYDELLHIVLVKVQFEAQD